VSAAPASSAHCSMLLLPLLVLDLLLKGTAANLIESVPL
jgi:hypothetical protein